jgi:hypothetical protein
MRYIALLIMMVAISAAPQAWAQFTYFYVGAVGGPPTVAPTPNGLIVVNGGTVVVLNLGANL